MLETLSDNKDNESFVLDSTAEIILALREAANDLESVAKIATEKQVAASHAETCIRMRIAKLLAEDLGLELVEG